MATLDNIDSPVWGISILGYGAIAQGLASIRQCIDIILRTRKNSDPLRPEFGSDIFKYIDLPENIAIPNIKKAIIDALEIWETRIKVTGVSHYIESYGKPVFTIGYKVVDQNVTDAVTFNIAKGVTAEQQDAEVILQAFFPPNPKGYRYQISFLENGTQVLPAPIEYGYESLSDLFNWIKTNWLSFGRWFMLADRIMCYIRSADVDSASLGVSLLPVREIKAEFPYLAPTGVYSVMFKVAGQDIIPQMPGYDNFGDILDFAKENWSQYGKWYIKSDLAVDGQTPIYQLICVSENEDFNAELIISTLYYKVLMIQASTGKALGDSAPFGRIITSESPF
ncbi:GPW/gp25 family protein [Arachidicoccus terrestris]|uniref:GPW/gp25 family protein n=1 Tax=Arachidicoccus terrestris TaxID=2875539 RepID=UPI001CC7752A|nr:GPW/gp25 family protein [Arachidicoccus terrestris]UAY56270.1 GPW/gp25 family protein [Arachidicoccus terrestris]